MNALTRFCQGFKKGYRAQQRLNAEREKEPNAGKWKQRIRGFLTVLGIALMAGLVHAYREGGWHHIWSEARELLPWVALAFLIAMGLLWLRDLVMPLVMLLRDEGIAGCWRWTREKVFRPVMYGRRGK